MPAHVIVLAAPRPDKSEVAAQYAQATEPLRVAAGGEVVVRGPVLTTIAGEQMSGIGIVLKFPDTDAAAGFFAQDEYQRLIPMRDEIFERLEIHIVGE